MDRHRSCWRVALFACAALAASNSGAETPAASRPASSRPRVVLLPVDFTVYEQGAAVREPVPDWTSHARDNLKAAADAALSERAGLDMVPPPALSPEEEATLDDHVALAKLITRTAVTLKGAAWSERRKSFDRQLGPGLEFLRARTDADYALLIHGVQVNQSAGVVLTQLVAASVGIIPLYSGRSHLDVTLVDLRSGEVAWFNSTDGVEFMGLQQFDIRSQISTEKVLRRLLQPYPVIPSLQVRP